MARKVVSYLTYKSQQMWRDSVVYQYNDTENPGNAEGVFMLEKSDEVLELGRSFKESLRALQGLVRATRERLKMSEQGGDHEKSNRSASVVVGGDDGRD